METINEDTKENFTKTLTSQLDYYAQRLANFHEAQSSSQGMNAELKQNLFLSQVYSK